MILSIITKLNHKKITNGIKMSKLQNFSKKEDISVLIVEDESVLALGLEMTLNEMGYNDCFIANNEKSVIEIISKFSPSIILMDINLKGLVSGIEIANKVWNMYKTPIIFLTSYCDDKTIKKSMECEPYGYLIKPCRDKEIDAAILMAIHKHNYFYNNKDMLNKNIENKIALSKNIYFEKLTNSMFKDNSLVKLTNNEIKFMNILINNIEKVVSFEQISNYIWRESVYDLGKLRTLVYRLRNKIEIDIFENVYEIGYRLKLDI